MSMDRSAQEADKCRKVVIVGGGFAGLYAAKALANKGVQVTLIDRRNHHTFQPLLYQVAASVLSPSQIAGPLRHILAKAKNIEVILGEVTDFNLEGKIVRIAAAPPVQYDTLIVAAGARHSYFGHDEWEVFAPGLKTLEDATNIRSRILSAFEHAEAETFHGELNQPLNFAVIGAGPTGVELAGVIADVARTVVERDYHLINTAKARVMLFEGASRVLGTYSEALSAKAKSQLEQLGVEVRTDCLVKGIEDGRVLVGDEWIPVRVAIWATGVAASPLGKLLSAEVDRSGRVPVNPDMSLPDHPEVFVIGDMASLIDASGRQVPGLGASAMQMGKATAHNILRDIAGQPRVPFRYVDKGNMATIGKHRAIAQIGKIEFSGFVAWIMWGVVHVLLLIGFRNRFSVMREWIWAYLTNQTSAQLITNRPEPAPGKVTND